jgi:hypothetical protein
VRAVRRDDEKPSVTQLQQAVVEAVAVEDDVGEQPAVLVTLLGIELQHHPPAGEVRLGIRARGVAEALHRLARIDHLGRVDPEQADLLDAPSREAHDNSVAIDVSDHGCGNGCRGMATREPTPPDAPEQGGHDHREHRQATSHGPGAGHARNVSGPGDSRAHY